MPILAIVVEERWSFKVSINVMVQLSFKLGDEFWVEEMLERLVFEWVRYIRQRVVCYEL